MAITTIFTITTTNEKQKQMNTTTGMNWEDKPGASHPAMVLHYMVM